MAIRLTRNELYDMVSGNPVTRLPQLSAFLM